MTRTIQKNNQRDNNQRDRKIDPALLDQLMKNYNPAKPEELIGRDGLLSDLKKALIERALSAELDLHLGYKKNQINSNDGSNYRNGSGSKTVITDDDKISIEVPRDRDASFEPLMVKKGQRTFLAALMIRLSPCTQEE